MSENPRHALEQGGLTLRRLRLVHVGEGGGAPRRRRGLDRGPPQPRLRPRRRVPLGGTPAPLGRRLRHGVRQRRPGSVRRAGEVGIVVNLWHIF